MLPDRVSNPGPLTYESGAHTLTKYTTYPFCFSETSMTTRRCFREGPAYHWEEEEEEEEKEED